MSKRSRALAESMAVVWAVAATVSAFHGVDAVFVAIDFLIANLWLMKAFDQ